MQTTATTQTNRDSNALATLVDAYDCELAARREQLRHDLSSYQARLCELRKADPADKSGLQRLYATHVCEIEKLLAETSTH
ncbi:MAG: hypothetical protein ACPHUF_01000 [Gammaproteobacteria bacterium]